LMNVVMLPMWLLSGIFFASDRFPDALQPMIRALPLTLLIDALRAVILEAAPLGSQAARLLGLALWGGVSLGLARRWCRWRWRAAAVADALARRGGVGAVFPSAATFAGGCRRARVTRNIALRSGPRAAADRGIARPTAHGSAFPRAASDRG